MKYRPFLISLITLGICASSQAAPDVPTLESKLGRQPLQAGTTADCKPKGDGTFTEIVTTMASVLAPAEGIRMLDTYCEPCMKQKFGLSRP